MSYYGFPKYVSVAEKKAKAEKKLKQLKKKNPDIQPIVIEGSALATTWWGKEWNKNLERYADFSNRIGRGRSYVRHSAVLDLKIKPGKVVALIQGSSSKPYSVSIKIAPIPAKNWTAIKTNSRGKMDSLQQLLAGKFPKKLGTFFTQDGDGLFPTPKEISFDCSCPDWATMCKHVAAALYGIGARLDKDPGLFFLLRKVNINDLLAETVKESKNDLLSKAAKKTSRVIEDESGLSDLFGINLGDTTISAKPKKIKKSVKSIKKPSQKSKQVKKSNIEIIEEIIRKRKKGIPVYELIDKAGIEAQKVRNVLFRLKSQGKIKNVSRGVYVWEKAE